jgi:patatin-like phospholipase/acyl hydrolase
MTYRILALDGGGVRGQFTITLLRRLSKALPDWIDQTDLFAGTSVGAVLALGLATGRKPRQMEELFRRRAPHIFRPTSRIPLQVARFFRAGYSVAPLDRFFEDVLGDLRLQDLDKQVVVPAMRLDNGHSSGDQRSWEPVVFHNYGGNGNRHGQLLVRQVARYATATPTIFPSVDGYVDGGVYAINPSLVALTQAQAERCASNGPQETDDIVLLSIGTGRPSQYLEGKRKDWGYLRWQKHLIDLMSSGSMGLVNQQCRQLLGGRYHRLSQLFEEKICAHDTGCLDKLIDLAEGLDLTQTVAWLGTHWLGPASEGSNHTPSSHTI